MGKKFGNLAYIRNIIYVRMSPYEQRIIPKPADMWRGFRRDFVANVPYMVMGLGPCYLLYLWTENEHNRLMRKNPADFANDE